VAYLTQSISQFSLKTGEEGIQANAGGSSGEKSEVNGPEKTRLLWGVRTVPWPIGYRTSVDMKAAGNRTGLSMVAVLRRG